MSEREAYQQKMKAQLDEWAAEVDRLRARASRASADAKLELDRQVKDLESELEEGRAKLAEVEKASDDAWESLKDGLESAWTSLRTAFSDAAARLKQ